MKSNNKSKFFLMIYLIPIIIISILLLLTTIGEEDSLTWYEVGILFSIFALIWFLISYFINYIVMKIKGTTKEKIFIEAKNYKLIKNILLILFILSLSTICIGLTLLDIIPQHGLNYFKNLWVFWCLIPIPLLSLILGFKYKKRNFSCTKNIIGGAIITTLLFVLGLYSFFPSTTAEYTIIYDYKNVIPADIPSNGELEIVKWNSADKDITNYTTIYAYYTESNIANLLNSIKYNDKWLTDKNLKSELKIFMPTLININENSYYSIYNETTNQYNIVPEKSGDYKIYTMVYNTLDNKLEIHEFTYTYTQ